MALAVPGTRPYCVVTVTTNSYDEIGYDMRLALLTFGLFSGLSASAAVPAAAFADPPKVLHMSLLQDPDILDPTLSGSYVGRIVFAGMCDKLFDFDSSLNIVPQLATGYSYKDPTHLILHLRPGVLFQDGEKLDADAVKYTLNRDLTMPGSLRRGEINDIQSIEVIDPLTVELVLKAPDSALLAQLADRAGIIIAPQAAEAEGANFGLHPVCAGPFSFVERVPEQKIVLKKFPGYWDAKDIHFDEVDYVPFVNSEVGVANLQTGQLDMLTGMLPNDVATIERDPKLEVVSDTSLANVGIVFNVANGPASQSPIGQHAGLRHAFELALDRTALINVVYNGLYTPIAQANSPSSQFYVPSIVPPTTDLAAAQKLVAESGIKTPIAVTLLVPNSPDFLQAAQVIQAMEQPAGFDVKIQAMEFASSLATARAGNFQAYLILWSGRADADGNMYSFLHSGYGFNYGHYDNEQVNALLDQARVAQSVADRTALYAKVWEIHRQDLPEIYLWSPKNIVGLKKTLLGFDPVPDGIIRLQGMHFAN
jgi:peptide/nickel transport system substrate-binding protein